jgi:hypothetical protein
LADVLEALPAARARAAAGAARYAGHRVRVAAAQAARVRAAQDIGPAPARADPARHESARLDLRRFCEAYLAETFDLPWSADHLRVLARLQEAVLRGGLFAFAMPRGGGKTSLAEAAALWAVLYGHRRFISLLAVSADRAQELVEHMKGLLGFRQDPEGPLTQDFGPELAPFLALEGEPRRCLGQKSAGRPTFVRWQARRLVCGALAGSLAAGSVVSASGLTGGGVRGQRMRLADSREVVRPDLALVDDPQDDEIAASASQVRARVRLLNGAVLGMAGPTRRIAAVATVTVIQPDDVASRLLDHEQSPDWRGERMRMLRGLPASPRLWEDYRRRREEDLAAGTNRAGEFYREHQAAMDRGLEASWAARFDAEGGEVSAIQAAMNLKFRDEETFQAEYQNDPAPPQSLRQALSPAAVMARTNGYPRGAVPPAATRLTMFVDLHDRLLYWAVCAWEENFTGYLVAYGSTPAQDRRTFTLADAPRTLARAYPGAGTNGAIQAGLEALLRDALAREWDRGGAHLSIERILVDAGYKPGVAADVKRRLGGPAVWLAKGAGIRASRRPIAAYARRPGETIGLGWYVPNVRKTGEFPHVLVDVNYWKTFVHAALATAAGDPGALTLFGRDGREHELLAEHLARSEYSTEVTGPWGTVREWSALPARPDNHWLDCLVGCAAAASMCGVKAVGEERRPAGRSRRRYTRERLRGAGREEEKNP